MLLCSAEMAGSHVTLHVALWVLGHELSVGSKSLMGFPGPLDADSWGRVHVSERYGAQRSAQLGWAGLGICANRVGTGGRCWAGDDRLLEGPAKSSPLSGQGD